MDVFCYRGGAPTILLAFEQSVGKLKRRQNQDKTTMYVYALLLCISLVVVLDAHIYIYSMNIYSICARNPYFLMRSVILCSVFVFGIAVIIIISLLFVYSIKSFVCRVYFFRIRFWLQPRQVQIQGIH